MQDSDLQLKASTYKKLDAILSASKLKVVNQMSKIKLEASHYYTMSLFAKNIFEKAFKLYSFESEVYQNKFASDKEINIVFLEEKLTLSPSREKVLRKFFAFYDPENLNLVVAKEDPAEDLQGYNYIYVPSADILALSQEITQRYVSRKYKRVNVISSLSEENEKITILPMVELKQTGEYKYDAFLQADVNFLPSLDVVIERSFLDYVKGLIKYFYVYGHYSALKATLLKHESSLDALDNKLEELRREMNKLRQAKITTEILEAGEVQSD